MTFNMTNHEAQPDGRNSLLHNGKVRLAATAAFVLGAAICGWEVLRPKAPVPEGILPQR